jgi:hypothetical protein
VTTLGPGEVRARKRPFAIVAVTGLRILAGFCLAWPLASLLGASGVGLRPEGDRALFEGGGYLLLDVARAQGSELTATARGLLPVLLLGLALSAACNAALLVALNLRERSTLGEWLSRIAARLPAFLVLGVGTTLGQLLLLIAGVFGADTIPESLSKPLLTTLGQGAIWLVVALAAAALGGFADVTKAALVRHESKLEQSLLQAFHYLRERPLQACFGWFPYAVVFVLAAALVAKLTEAIDVSRPGAWRVGCVFVLHQLVVLVSVAARAGWFARALRIMATAEG